MRRSPSVHNLSHLGCEGPGPLSALITRSRGAYGAAATVRCPVHPAVSVVYTDAAGRSFIIQLAANSL